MQVEADKEKAADTLIGNLFTLKASIFIPELQHLKVYTSSNALLKA